MKFKSNIMVMLVLLLVGVSSLAQEATYAHITVRNKIWNFHDPVALYCPTPAEKSHVGGADNLPVLTFYFFRHAITDEQKTTFVSAIAANQCNGAPEYPYAILELGLEPDQPLGPDSVRVFNVGRCLSEKKLTMTGAMLTDPAQVAQWKVDINRLSGKLEDGAVIDFKMSFEHKASHYEAEFCGSVFLRLVSRSRLQTSPAG